MKVLIIKTNDVVTPVQIFAQGNNEISSADLRKLVSSNAEMLYARKISRLAYLYVLFVEKGDKVHSINKIATMLTGDHENPVRGDAVLARTNHLGSGQKILALEPSEVQKVTEYIELVKKRLSQQT